jgi:hypothetical protein
VKANSGKIGGVVLIDLQAEFEAQIVCDVIDHTGCEQPAILINTPVVRRVMAEILLAVIAFAAEVEGLRISLETARAGTDAGTEVVGPGIVIVVRVAPAVFSVEMLGSSFKNEVHALSQTHASSGTHAIAMGVDADDVVHPVVVIAATRKRAVHIKHVAERFRKSDAISIGIAKVGAPVVGVDVFQVDKVVGKALRMNCRGSQRSEAFCRPEPVTSLCNPRNEKRSHC